MDMEVSPPAGTGPETIEVIYSSTSDKNEVHKWELLTLTVYEVKDKLRTYFPSIQQTNVTISYSSPGNTKASGDVKELNEAELNSAFEKFQRKEINKIFIKVNGKKWPKFPHPFHLSDYGVGQEPKALVELKMMTLSATIRRKPDWHIKMNNPEIIAKWTEEAKAEECTESQINYVLQELKYYAELRDPSTGMEVSDIDTVWHSDTLINDSLKKELIEGVAVLEDIPETKKDWHPGSNNQVWDLVHPSLFPLAYGKTKRVKKQEFGTPPVVPTLKFCGSGGETFPPPEIPENHDFVNRIIQDYSYSTKFCWLPSEFSVDKNGKVTIDSYINNLHPRHHKDLYSTIGKIFGKFVPLFEKVINDQVNLRKNRVEVDAYAWYGTEEFAGDDEDSDYDERYEEWTRNRGLNQPEPPAEFTPPSAIAPENRISLLGSKLQVIVKLANIVLTPDNPKYKGGVWHVEGMRNEGIIATGIYYYDVENISESELGFRQNICEPNYEQYDDRGVSGVYGLSNEDPLNQVLGAVITKENRCLAFPNFYQHCVQPFKLVDPTKPGHRKILVFFLIDPGNPIISTYRVPPQQKDWFIEELVKIPPFDEVLPGEVLDYLIEYLDWPISLEKAKEWREELMEERKYFISANNDECFARPFSLCEH